jgi:hypothetical protein
MTLVIILVRFPDLKGPGRKDMSNIYSLEFIFNEFK